ncbi:energy transducer TonB [Trinickia sp.]|uniref:energy transducer TonB n=1 Tax=Trinickia sp. TaxID=2571163 RepID=UPI003F803CED
MTSTAIPSTMLLTPAQPGSKARTLGVAAFVVAAHVALLAAYVTFTRSGLSGLREAHAVAPTGPLRVVLLAAPSAADRPAAAGPLSHAPIHPHVSPAEGRALPRKPARTEAIAPAPRTDAPKKLVVAQPETAAGGANGVADAAASAASAAKAPSAVPAARFSAHPETKRADEVVCRIPAPAYPARARRLEEEGTATVRMTLDTGGRASAVSLEQSSGFTDLDSAALDAVRGAVCEPYRERGEAVPVSVIQSVDFKLAAP